MRNNAIIEVVGLPDSPIDAAVAFHHVYLDQARRLAREGDLVLIFDPADHTHRSWRIAVVEELAREAAPRRINGVEGDSTQDVSETLLYLQSADAVTGQLFTIG